MSELATKADLEALRADIFRQLWMTGGGVVLLVFAIGRLLG